MRLTNDEITAACADICVSLASGKVFYGVPRGGIAPAYYIAGATDGFITDNPAEADYIVDDLVDSGKTRTYYNTMYPNAAFIAIYDKQRDKEIEGKWLIFPWEVTREGDDESILDAFTRMLEYTGEDATRPGLKDTPKRMAKAWKEWSVGYNINPLDFVTTFEDGAEGYDQIIIEKNLPFYSKCEHHLESFFGTASIGYIPNNGRIIGISKLGRILDMFARRLQVQERMTNQIADCIKGLIDPQGVAVVVEGRHLCTESRGISKQGQTMVTSAMRGVFMDKQAAREEFLLLTR